MKSSLKPTLRNLPRCQDLTGFNVAATDKAKIWFFPLRNTASPFSAAAFRATTSLCPENVLINKTLFFYLKRTFILMWPSASAVHSRSLTVGAVTPWNANWQISPHRRSLATSVIKGAMPQIIFRFSLGFKSKPRPTRAATWAANLCYYYITKVVNPSEAERLSHGFPRRITACGEPTGRVITTSKYFIWSRMTAPKTLKI